MIRKSFPTCLPWPLKSKFCSINIKNLAHMALTPHQRIPLFLVGCLGLRLGIAEITRRSSLDKRKAISVFYILVGLGMLFFFASGTRPVGPETGGGPIWWNSIRPLHALLYGIFAAMAFSEHEKSWVVLYADVTLGLAAWSTHQAIK